MLFLFVCFFLLIYHFSSYTLMHARLFHFLLFTFSITYIQLSEIHRSLLSLSPTTAFMTVMTYIDTRCFRPYASPPLSLQSQPATFPFLSCLVGAGVAGVSSLSGSSYSSERPTGRFSERDRKTNKFKKIFGGGRGGGGVAMDFFSLFFSFFSFRWIDRLSLREEKNSACFFS